RTRSEARAATDPRTSGRATRAVHDLPARLRPRRRGRWSYRCATGRGGRAAGARRPPTGRLPSARGRSRGEHSPEQRERPLFVERLIEVAALRALHARRTAALARTPLEQPRRGFHPALAHSEAPLCDSDPPPVPRAA